MSLLHAQEEKKVPTIAKEEKRAGKRFVTWKHLNEWENKSLQLHDYPNPNASWYGKAGLGILFTYGPLSLEPKLSDLWEANFPSRFEVSPEKVFTLAQEINPTEFKPKQWMRKLSKAGFEYVVFTAKGEDGFALWPSSATNYDTELKLGSRDLVKEFVNAARSAKLKVGLAYSANNAYFDKDFRNFSSKKKKFVNYKHEEVSPAPKIPNEHLAKKNALIKKEIIELMTKYGKLDVFYPQGSLGGLTVNQLRKASPNMAVANTSYGYKGDFISLSSTRMATPERLSVLQENKWPVELRLNLTAGGTYYNENSVLLRAPSRFLIQNVVDLRAKGANVLIRITLSPDGSIPNEAVKFLEVMEEWMPKLSPALTEVTGGFPKQGEETTADMTFDGKKGYALFLEGGSSEENPIILKGLPKPSSARGLLGGEKVGMDYDKDTETLKLYFEEPSRDNFKHEGNTLMNGIMIKFREELSDKYKFHSVQGFEEKR